MVLRKVFTSEIDKSYKMLMNTCYLKLLQVELNNLIFIHYV